MMIFYLLEMPRKSSHVKKNVIDEAAALMRLAASVSGEGVPSTIPECPEESPKSITIEVPAVDSPLKRGRKVKYQTDEERREARREQNRRYRERKKNELIALRRSAAKREKEESINTETDKNNDSNDEQVDAIPIEL